MVVVVVVVVDVVVDVAAAATISKGGQPKTFADTRKEDPRCCAQKKSNHV